MEVEVPQGVRAGQVIGVTVPDGRQAALTVPEGSLPGSTLSLSFDPVAGTLSLRMLPSAEGAAVEPSNELHLSRDASSGQVMVVQIPAGVAPGQLLGINVPTGQQINVAVPNGAAEGSSLHLWFDPAAGTLTHLQ